MRGFRKKSLIGNILGHYFQISKREMNTVKIHVQKDIRVNCVLMWKGSIITFRDIGERGKLK